MTLLGSLVLIGPWPVDNASFEGTSYQRRTLDRLDDAPAIGPAGPIRVGLAEVDIAPATPLPLAGFIGQTRTPYVGVDTTCSARALTIESGRDAVTILTADLLLINAKLAREVVDRAGLRPDQVYFTSSHTHGGPGGWGDHPLEMLVAGSYDPAYFESLAARLAEVVRRSRARAEPAEMGFVEVQAHGRQKNRVDPTLPTHDALSALIFRAIGAPEAAPPLAILTFFGAHATVSHPVPPRLGGDYPAALCAELKRRTGARSVLFASGAVGDASPSRPKAPSQFRSAQALGIALADDLAAALPSAKFARDVSMGNLRLDVDLPTVRLPFFATSLRFSPLSTWWIADRRTHLHALRIGPAVLVGFPGDYSGHLADKLDASTRDLGLSMVPTSFDGDFRGYLVSEDVFRRVSCYETRWMNFYGPWTGDYLSDLAKRMAGRLSTPPTIAMARPSMNSDDSRPRIGLAVLLIAMGLEGWPRRREVARGIVRMGVATVGIATTALLAFLVDPDLFDWSRFWLPGWARLVGLPIGLFALIRSRVRGPAPTTPATLGLACLLLAGNWVVALMMVRGLARTWFADRSTGERPLNSIHRDRNRSGVESRPGADQKL